MHCAIAHTVTHIRFLLNFCSNHDLCVCNEFASHRIQKLLCESLLKFILHAFAARKQQQQHFFNQFDAHVSRRKYEFGWADKKRNKHNSTEFLYACGSHKIKCDCLYFLTRAQSNTNKLFYLVKALRYSVDSCEIFKHK